MDTDIETSQLDPSGYVEHQVPHVRQRHSWDCGISCVMMLLPREQRQELHQDLARIAQQEGFQQSTWTIDLCYLLKRYNIEHCMYTMMAGVNEEYCKLSYYDKIIDLDRERVQRRFAEAGAHGLRVSVGRAGCGQLLAHLARGPALVLVDAARLACRLCRANRLRAELGKCFGSPYRGHYILVVGYAVGRAGSVRVLYRDPGVRARLCACSPRVLRTARAAPGTDHDVLLVYKSFR